MQLLFVHVDVELFLQRIGEGRNAMVQGDRLDGKHRIFEHSKKAGVRMNHERMNRRRREHEAVRGVKRRLPNFCAVKFPNFDNQRIPIHQIPGVAAQLAVHVVDQSGGPYRRSFLPRPSATRTTASNPMKWSMCV